MKIPILLSIPRLRPIGIDEASPLGQSVESFNTQVEEINSELRCLISQTNRAATKSRWSTCSYAEQTEAWYAAAGQYQKRIPRLKALIDNGHALAALIGIDQAPWIALAERAAKMAQSRHLSDLEFPRVPKQ